MTDTDAESAAPGRGPDGSGGGASRHARRGVFSRLALFIRQVVAELRKVIWPTRSELVNYTTVVVIFVLVMAAIVALLDYLFAAGAFWLFDRKS